MKILFTYILLLIIVLFCHFSVHSSPLKVSWHSGQITLCNKAVLEGSLSYNWLAEMIMIQQADGRINTFSAEQVLEFGWFDNFHHKYRSFKSLSGFTSKGQARYTFFEICMDGSLIVVRRLRRPHGLWKRVLGHPGNYTDQPTMSKNTDQFDYFVQDAGRLLSVGRFYTDIYATLMMAYNQPLQKYIMTHNINSQTIIGRLVIIDHYNFLVQQNTSTASTRPYGNSPD